jgi:ubiquinone/menaquinone biosynthesis C-methylase UbiE
MLDQLEADWDQAAHDDAFFNIMTVHGMTPDEFWKSGEDEIGAVVERLGGGERALDFGCGVGRLTRPLADYFTDVDGVDISSEMILLASTFDERPTYTYNPLPDLRIFPDDTYDLVYSNIVLQHMDSELAGGYVKEFLRVARGHVVFQIPEGPSNLGGALGMNGTPRETVEGWLNGAEILDVEQNDASGAGYRSYRYTVKP